MFKKITAISGLAIATLLIGLLLGLLLIYYHDSAVGLQHFLQIHVWQFVAWRYLVFFLVIYFWRSIICWLGRLRKWHPRVMVKLIRLRWQVLAFFVLFELLFVYNLFGKSIGFIVGIL